MLVKVLIYDKKRKKKFTKIYRILHCIAWEHEVYAKLGINAEKRYRILKHKFKTAYTFNEIKEYVKITLSHLKKMNNKKLYKELKNAYLKSYQRNSLLPLKEFIEKQDHIIFYNLRFINECDIRLKK